MVRAASASSGAGARAAAGAPGATRRWRWRAGAQAALSEGPHARGGLVSQAFTALSARRGGALGRTLSRLEPQVPPPPPPPPLCSKATCGRGVGAVQVPCERSTCGFPTARRALPLAMGCTWRSAAGPTAAPWGQCLSFHAGETAAGMGTERCVCRRSRRSPAGGRGRGKGGGGCGEGGGAGGAQVPGAEARAHNLMLRGLAIKLGPDLRVLYPMNVLNFGIAGEVAVSGPAHPDHLKLAGTVRWAPPGLLTFPPPPPRRHVVALLPALRQSGPQPQMRKGCRHAPCADRSRADQALNSVDSWSLLCRACRPKSAAPGGEGGGRGGGAGAGRLEGGEINLVATQLQLEREHPNRLVFTPEAGLDPTVDVALAGSRLRAVIKGRASAWQDHIVLTSAGSRSQAAAGGAPPAPAPALPLRPATSVGRLPPPRAAAVGTCSTAASFSDPWPSVSASWQRLQHLSTGEQPRPVVRHGVRRRTQCRACSRVGRGASGRGVRGRSNGGGGGGAGRGRGGAHLRRPAGRRPVGGGWAAGAVIPRLQHPLHPHA